MVKLSIGSYLTYVYMYVYMHVYILRTCIVYMHCNSVST